MDGGSIGPWVASNLILWNIVELFSDRDFIPKFGGWLILGKTPPIFSDYKKVLFGFTDTPQSVHMGTDRNIETRPGKIRLPVCFCLLIHHFFPASCNHQNPPLINHATGKWEIPELRGVNRMIIKKW